MKRDYSLIRKSIELGLRDRDTRPIEQWAYDNVFLPLGGSSAPGKFLASTAPHTIDVLADIRDPAVRQVNILKPIQGVGTTAMEVGFLWLMSTEPGPAQFNYQTEQSRDKNWEPRLLEMMKRCPPLTSIIPPQRRIRRDGMTLLNGVPVTTQAATIGNLQSNSIRYQFNDELWEWGEGMFGQADARIDAFYRAGISKQANASQGGKAGTEWHRICFADDCSFSEWHVPCPKCGKLQVPKMEVELDGKTVRAMHWDKDSSRIWYECIYCGGTFEDGAQLKNFWLNEGKYVTYGELKANRTRRWNAVYWSPWPKLVKEYRNAIDVKNKHRIFTPLMDFVMKRMADFWKDDDSEPIVLPSVFEIEGAISTGTGVKFLTIDVQDDHLWCLVREWNRDGSSRLLHWGRALSFSDAHEIAVRFGIKEANYRECITRERSGERINQKEASQLLSSGVFVDTGGNRTQQVYSACWRYGWVGLKGASDKREFFKHRIPHGNTFVETVELYDQINTPINFESEGCYLRFLIWATVGAKNILQNLRDGASSHKWEVPKNIGHDYMRQINSEVKEDGKWRKLGSRANHAWDCEAMQVLAASMAGIFKLS